MKILITLIFLSLTSLVQAQPNTKIRVDVNNAIGGSVSSVFKGVKFIQLETTKESLFGRIKQLIVTEKNFIIYDDTRNEILIFTKSGQYVSKIKALPGAINIQGWGTLFDSISFDNSRDEIVITTPSFQRALINKIFRFNLSGKLVKTEPLNRLLYSNPVSLEGNYLVKNRTASNIQEASEHPYSFTLLNDSFALPKGLLKRDSAFYLPGVDRLNGSDFTLNHNNGKDFILASSDYYDNKFYKIDTTGIANVYSMIFPDLNTMPPDFLSNRDYDEKRHAFLKDHPNVIYSIQNISTNDQWLSFWFQNDNYHGYLLYNLKTGIPYRYDKIAPDSLSHNLPVFGDYTAAPPIIYDNEIYTSISAIDLVDAYETGSGAGKSFDSEAITLMKNMTKMQNPVLVELTLKDNL